MNRRSFIKLAAAAVLAPRKVIEAAAAAAPSAPMGWYSGYDVLPVYPRDIPLTQPVIITGLEDLK